MSSTGSVNVDILLQAVTYWAIESLFLNFFSFSFFQVEVSPSDGNDMQVAYEELSVLVSADTFEKVDEAVALIELLVTSVSVSSLNVEAIYAFSFYYLFSSAC